MTKILLVEDDKSLREIYGVRLLAEGYDIVSAGDGEEALAMAIKDRPDLIVSDVMMPKISGFDMLDILRSTTETKGIKVIMMTALSSEDQRQRGVALGADRYLVKSQVGIEDVVRTVHEVLGDAPTNGGVAAPHMPMADTTPPAHTNSIPTPPSPPIAEHAPSPMPTPVSAQPEQPSIPQTPPSLDSLPSMVNSTPTPPAAPAPDPSNGLPQPTAPFSTSRPANLADRVIQPVPGNAGSPNFSDMMSQELDSQIAAAQGHQNIADNQPSMPPAGPTPGLQEPPLPPMPPAPPMPSAANPNPGFDKD